MVQTYTLGSAPFVFSMIPGDANSSNKMYALTSAPLSDPNITGTMGNYNLAVFNNTSGTITGSQFKVQDISINVKKSDSRKSLADSFVIFNEKRSTIVADLFYPHSQNFDGGSGISWIWLVVGGVLLIGIAVFIIFKLRSNRTDDEEDADYKQVSEQNDEEAKTYKTAKNQKKNDSVESEEEEKNQ